MNVFIRLCFYELELHYSVKAYIKIDGVISHLAKGQTSLFGGFSIAVDDNTDLSQLFKLLFCKIHI